MTNPVAVAVTAGAQVKPGVAHAGRVGRGSTGALHVAMSGEERACRLTNELPVAYAHHVNPTLITSGSGKSAASAGRTGRARSTGRVTGWRGARADGSNGTPYPGDAAVR